MRKVCPFHESWRVELGKDTCKLEIEVWEFSSLGSQHHWGTKPGLTFISFLFFRVLHPNLLNLESNL